ncbi:glycoside hydrolase family 76 protein [Lophiostoma macrostomum CBS 122681]|uniref:Glycoside hydrolase family 76 protein n=1 Tax=Lophiostoma macrostomum CBS 122681 TaxID=1314788 RepID=A0A6A6TJI7_9PLEO|nr:glycoside hydrolase family 76 protein [Lophiostoma macrostomum CBS 122681]
MITTLAKFGSYDSSFKQTASDIIANTHAKAINGSNNGVTNWLNGFYDDEGWWALGWIASYDLTGDSKYLDSAKFIFEDMTGGHNTPCDGGIWWNKARTYISAISNELFLSTAAHLANRVGDDEKQEYLNWATAEWDWFSNIGLINSDNVINDGVDNTTCKNNGGGVFTYNQGVILGGLAELAKATGDSSYTDAAKTIAEGAMKNLTQNGILTEGGKTLDEQGAQFKGVFVRGLAALNQQAPQAEYVEFLKKNADEMWSKDRNDEGVIGPNWSGDAQGDYRVTSHSSGIDLLVAAAQAT